MKIPSFINEKMVDENGHLTAPWKNTLANLMQQLQGSLSDEGVSIPHQDTATITSLNTQKSEGNLLYNKETKEMYVNLDGTYKKITTS